LAPGPWVKLLDSSFISSNNLSDNVPTTAHTYDSSDPGHSYFIDGVGGIVAAPSVFLNNKQSSAGNWSAAYTPATAVMTAANYLSYVQARKQFTTITDPLLTQVTADGIYYYNGSINWSSVPAQLNSYNIVLISSGIVTIDMATFNPTKSVAILANEIDFTAQVTEADGIFIANTVTTGTTAAQGLKIVGNLISQGATFTNDRVQADQAQPSLYIVFGSAQYTNLLPYLSTVSYQWNQTQ